jgi:glycerol-3-phosphate O-acyltransferase
VYKLSDNLIITAPAVLATVVLMHRKGISDDALSEQVQWLCKELKSRGIKVARSQSDSSISISNTLSLLSDTISKSKKNMFEVQVSFEQDSFVKLFTMTYYRNTLTHIFWEESLVLLALTSFGHEKIIGKNVKEDDKAIGTKEQSIGTNVTLEQLWA